MGFMSYAVLANPPADLLSKIDHNVRVNHNGVHRGRWFISIKSYRSTLGTNPEDPNGPPSQIERSMTTVTMGDVAYVFIEDPSAPHRSDAVAQGHGELTHYRQTLLTVKPPGNLEQLLVQVKARWMPVRQATSSGQSRGAASGLATNALLSAAELIVDGRVYSIGDDWIVKAGLVKNKDQIRGLLLEAEYLPLPYLQPDPRQPDFPPLLVGKMLSDIVPDMESRGVPGALHFSDEFWEDLLWSRDKEAVAEATRKAQAEKETAKAESMPNEDEEDDEDVYAYGLDIPPTDPALGRGDFIGPERDRRSALLMLATLKTFNAL